jgi:hypothetical protein
VRGYAPMTKNAKIAYARAHGTPLSHLGDFPGDPARVSTRRVYSHY